MALTKANVILQLTQLSGGVAKPEWDKMPVYKLLVELDLLKVKVPEESEPEEDFRSKIGGAFR
jgi:hypothetical protein